MVRNGTRRCDLCASEILGHGGADVCVVCRIAMEEDPEYGSRESHEVISADAEGFALAAIVGTSEVAYQALAANDEPKRRIPHGRRMHGPSEPEGVVQRFAAGLRAISRRRSLGRR